MYLQSITASYFLTLFTLFSRNHTNVNKSTINHETNIIWFIESNRQKIEFSIELNKVQQINFRENLARDKQIQQCFSLLQKQKKRTWIFFR